MSHVRQQIRDTIATALTSGVTSVYGRVYTSRFYPMRDTDTPGICVYTLIEQSSSLSMGESRLMRVLNVAVDIYATATNDADDTVDALAASVEAAVGADPTFGGIAKDSTIISTEIDLSGDGETPFVLARLTYSVEYVTSGANAETAL